VSEVFEQLRRRLEGMAAAAQVRALGSEAARRGVLEVRARLLARPLSPPEPEGTPAVRFALGAQSYALPMALVREVAKPPLLTRVPGTPAHVDGVCHHRGELLAVMDLRPFLAVGAAPVEGPPRLLVLGDGRPELGVRVDAVFDLVRVSPRALRGVDGAAAAVSGWLVGMTPDGTLVLDGRALLSDRRLYVDRSDATES
jgi:purine-binding chemotaxis protein CheW